MLKKSIFTDVEKKVYTEQKQKNKNEDCIHDFKVVKVM